MFDWIYGDIANWAVFCKCLSLSEQRKWVKKGFILNVLVAVDN